MAFILLVNAANLIIQAIESGPGGNEHRTAANNSIVRPSPSRAGGAGEPIIRNERAAVRRADYQITCRCRKARSILGDQNGGLPKELA